MHTHQYTLYHPKKKKEALMHIRVFANAPCNNYEIIMFQEHLIDCLDDSSLKEWIWNWYNEVIDEHVKKDSLCRITMVGAEPAAP